MNDDRPEDVLLQVNHVRYKKNEGQLSISHKKVGWILNNTQVYAVSVLYTDIKTQKISPEAKAKVQLQLILNDESTHIFHFSNPKGREVQMAERNQIKERLSQLLTVSKRQPPDELMEKKRLLEENPQLKKLYLELVPTNLLTPEQFWKEIAASYRKSLPPPTKLGVNGAFLADIKPRTDGNNGKVRYDVHQETIDAIFATYPSVEKKYNEYVPTHMAKSEFWTRFFQSHYYSAHTTVRSESLFSDCAKYDDKDWGKDLAKVINDPILCLKNIYEEMAFADTKEETAQKAGSNHMHATMIRRFNQHSQNILKAQYRTHQDRLYDEILAKNPEEFANGTLTLEPEQPKPKKARLLEKLTYSDLDDADSSKVASLDLQQKDRYLAGPPTNINVEPTHPHQIEALERELGESLQCWKPDLSSIQNHQLAHKTLQQISEKCREERGANSSSGVVEELPQELRAELSSVYSSGGELLKHYYSCFPPKTPQLISKLNIIHETLAKYHQQTLRPFQEKAIRDYNCRSSLLDHLIHMFGTASTKYDNWKSRYGGR